jgi:hypothetical protein
VIEKNQLELGAYLDMRVICTTVIRAAGSYEYSGRIIELDLPSGEIVMAMNLPDKGFIVGPRGGSRGGRGVRVFDNRIYVAIYNRILVYDLEWNLLSEIRHPHVVGHHEIQVDAQGVWCCSTVIDAVVKLDFEGNALFEWWASEDEAFLSWIKGTKVVWDRDIDYSTYCPPSPDVEAHPDHQFHINTVYCGDGRVYAYDLTSRALFAVWPRFEPIVRNPAWVKAHNVYPRGRDILVNISQRKTFEIWRMPNRLERLLRRRPYLVQRVVVVPGEGRSTQFSKSGWVRGRIDLGRNEFIVGCNPASLHYIRDGQVIRSWKISDDVNEAVHGLTLKQSDP